MPDRGSSTVSIGRRLGPIVISALLHACVIGAGFALVWTVRTLPEPEHATEATVVHFTMPALAEAPNDTAPPIEQERPKAIETIEPVPLDDPLAGLFDEPAVMPKAERAPERADPPEDLFAEPVAPAMREATFFSSDASGASDAKRIVYVIDASGSTTALFPAIARELERSLSKLKATQLATIVVAQGDPAQRTSIAMAAPPASDREPLLRATGSNARKLAAWFRDEVRPAGRSDFVPALERALGMQPDPIFLLAPATAPALIDDARTEQLLAELNALNPIAKRTGRRRSLIAIVHIGALYEGDPLSAIAAEHSGDTPMTPLTRNDLLEAP